MVHKTTQKQYDVGLGLLLSLIALFIEENITAEMFRRVRWAAGLVCPHCGYENTPKYCKYKWYVCKDCNKTFNDKTETILYYNHIGISKWMLAARMYLCGLLNGILINCIAEFIGRPYKSTYYMIRDMVDYVRNQQDKILYGKCETDKMYVLVASQTGYRRRESYTSQLLGSAQRSQEGTFKKNTSMATLPAHHQNMAGPYFTFLATEKT